MSTGSAAPRLPMSPDAVFGARKGEISQVPTRGQVLYGGYGAGPRGSYVVLVRTTPADFEAHRSDYLAWYDSVRLH